MHFGAGTTGVGCVLQAPCLGGVVSVCPVAGDVSPDGKAGRGPTVSLQ